MKFYRPCKFRKSKLGIFQCERHVFEHSYPETYEELYDFCIKIIPDNFCSYADFGFNMEEKTIHINCTHPFISRPMESFELCKTCQYAPPADELQSLGG